MARIPNFELMKTIDKTDGTWSFDQYLSYGPKTNY